ncbi:CLUMA_CG005284, isoform A [Clunio marinus]|uniref:CLUMA_CG005284, isoform A n=1 Tax=Clunio marinus TaxID=568069 RepID=A0A1J1HU82_9DIPT|nr:CLUMA_CG005284, isoform A [Clunio marinus]
MNVRSRNKLRLNPRRNQCFSAVLLKGVNLLKTKAKQNQKELEKLYKCGNGALVWGIKLVKSTNCILMMENEKAISCMGVNDSIYKTTITTQPSLKLETQ